MMPTRSVLSTSAVTTDHRKGRKSVEVYRAQYNNAGLDDDAAQRLNEHPGYAAYLAAGIRQFSIKQPDYTLARSILGGDFITAEEIMVARPDIVYSAEQVAELVATMPPETTLALLKGYGYGLMPQPPKALSLLDIHRAKPAHFYTKTGGWYESVPFAQNDSTGTGWLAIKKTPVNGSTSKDWDEQNKLITSAEYVPNAAEASWFITVFYDVRGVRLFESIYVRTSSIDSDGDHVNVGIFDAKGLYVDNHWDNLRVDNLGLACARKF